MVGRDWFVVGCRLIGVWMAYFAVSYFATFLDVRLGYSEGSSVMSSPGSYLTQTFAHVLIALYLLLGTRHLAWLCYEKDEPLKLGAGAARGVSETDLT